MVCVGKFLIGYRKKIESEKIRYEKIYTGGP